MQRFFSRISLMFQKLRHISCVPEIANSFSQNFHQMIALKKLRKMFFILSTYLLLVTRLSRCKAPGVVQVKLVENAVINIGLVRLFLYK